ncbi:hypothetical protein GCM10010468_61380 [Actinocorallia longicatena]|uniref:Uncharacterized protein n=1 Tax=Actinocorallia longicatena TaxID=111803 RepID=A0ABP6QH99_9ACTN
MLPLLAGSPSKEGLAAVRKNAKVPLWLPWPLPLGWLVTGFLHAGDAREGARATGVALTGPGLTSGPADMIMISEEPGVGLGAHLAGIPGPDPGDGFAQGPPHAKVTAEGRPLPLWAVEAGPDRAVYLGEAMGHWLWAILWPSQAGALMIGDLHLCDLREPGIDLDLPYGAACPWLEGTPGT